MLYKRSQEISTSKIIEVAGKPGAFLGEPMLHGFSGSTYDNKKDDKVKVFQRLIKGLIDRLLALIAIICLSPIMLIAAIGIKLSSKGPLLYKAKRMGRNVQPISVYKFRTMRVGADKEGAITGANDIRIFKWGEILRKTKVDELPQLFNILNGTMSVIGPRPEDIDIVENYYTEEEKRTLSVLPGLACPGSIYNYTHGEKYLTEGDTEDIYVNKLLHVKLALDLYYLDHWSLFYDFCLILRTVVAILRIMIGKGTDKYPYEYLKIYGNKDVIR